MIEYSCQLVAMVVESVVRELGPGGPSMLKRNRPVLIPIEEGREVVIDAIGDHPQIREYPVERARKALEPSLLQHHAGETL
jgi:hypothetical protein